jgi:sulfur transfer complex TusBCD TusB component (DsrH family)
MEIRSSVGYFSVEVRLEASYNMLIAAENEEEAVNVALNEDLPARSIEDFAKDVVRVVQMKQRVYLC